MFLDIHRYKRVQCFRVMFGTIFGSFLYVLGTGFVLHYTQRGGVHVFGSPEPFTKGRRHEQRFVTMVLRPISTTYTRFGRMVSFFKDTGTILVVGVAHESASDGQCNARLIGLFGHTPDGVTGTKGDGSFTLGYIILVLRGLAWVVCNTRTHYLKAGGQATMEGTLTNSGAIFGDVHGSFVLARGRTCFS